jgi:hypothetical protein
MSERTAERQQLAEKIQYLAALDRQLERLAVARSKLDLRDKEQAHAAARVALDEAKKRAPELLVKKMMGEEFEPALTVDHAQGQLEDAQRDLDEATAADGLLADEITQVEQRRSLAFHGRDTALAEVLRASPELEALCARIEQTRQQLYDFTWVLSAIGQRRLPRGVWDGILWGRDTGSGAPWKAALAAPKPMPTPPCRVNPPPRWSSSKKKPLPRGESSGEGGKRSQSKNLRFHHSRGPARCHRPILARTPPRARPSLRSAPPAPA